jgi:site-specific recombinase XerD
MTDDQIIERWLESRPSPLTREGYAADFERFRQFVGVDKRLSEVELGDVQRYARHVAKLQTTKKKKLRGSRQARLLNVVKSFYSFATKHQYLSSNPALALQVPKSEDALSERLLTREEVDQLIAAERNPRNQLLLRVIFYSGARVSEAIGLQWRHVKLNKEGGQLTLFGKGSETRVVVVPYGIYQALMAEKERIGGQENDYVFPSQKSPQLSRYQVFRIVKKAAKKAGLSWAISTHWLRHANATIALDHGAPLPLVQKTLGHKSMATTQKYLHVRPDDSSGLYLDKKK